jgi:hypothetical protein
MFVQHKCKVGEVLQPVYILHLHMLPGHCSQHKSN